MWIYLILLVPPLLVGLAHHRAPRLRPHAFALSAIILILFVGLRRELGGDWDNYLILFHRGATLPFAEAMAMSDPAYALLSFLVGRAGADIGVVNLICTAIMVAGVLAFARALPLPHVAMVVAVPVLIMIGGFNTTRQATAVGLAMLAVLLFRGGRRGAGAALLVLGALFHWSAAVLLPLVPLLAMRRAIPTWMLVAVGGAAGMAVVLAYLFVPPVSVRLAEYGPSGGAFYRAVPILIALVLFALAPRRLARDETERRIAAFFAALSLAALVVVPVFSTGGDRLGFYAIPFQMLILARAPMLLRDGWPRRLGEAAAMLPWLVLFLGWLAITPHRVCQLPYRTYLTDPAELRFEPPEMPRPTLEC